MALERKQGVSNLELMCKELLEEERVKEQRQEKKRQKKKKKRAKSGQINEKENHRHVIEEEEETGCSKVSKTQGCGFTMPDLSDLVPFHSGQVRNFYLLVLGQVQMHSV